MSVKYDPLNRQVLYIVNIYHIIGIIEYTQISTLCMMNHFLNDLNNFSLKGEKEC